MNLNAFIDRFIHSTDQRTLIRMVISSPLDKKGSLKSIHVTLAELKRGMRLNVVYRHETKDITKNYDFAEGTGILKVLLEKEFTRANLFTSEEDVSLVVNPDGTVRIRTTGPTLQPVTLFRHDHEKHRLIRTADNVYLRELGITNPNWEVKHEMGDKFRQINRYIELLAPEIRELNLPPGYRVADMGSGKGYLTFALYDYLSGSLSHQPVMTGVEFRRELVDECNRIAALAGFSGLQFVSGSIEEAELARIDILIALHACDTATDDAIGRGILGEASLIVVAPCCHKQIRRGMETKGNLMPLVRHGILRERQAEILTDTIRAMILEAYGYRTKVFEFISTEHTPKNVMIIGRKTAPVHPEKERILNEIEDLKRAFGIGEHWLERVVR